MRAIATSTRANIRCLVDLRVDMDVEGYQRFVRRGLLCAYELPCGLICRQSQRANS